MSKNRNAKETEHKICYMKRNLNLSVDISTYQEVKRTIPERQVSSLVDNLLKEYFKKQRKEKLAADYKSTARSKAMREEDKVWEGTIEDGIEDE